MLKKITASFIFLLLLSVFSFGFNLDLSTSPTHKVSNNCLSFVFVPSDYNGQDISCPSASDGSLSINAFGGTAPYNYAWEDGTFGIQRNNLNAGTYSLTVTDINGCSLSSSITLQDPSPLNIIKNILNPVSCANTPDGSLGASATGGTPPYNFQWENGNQGPTAENLTCGVYPLTVTDANGCSETAVFGLQCPPIMEVNITVTSNFNGFNVSCPEAADGGAEVNVQNGNAPYSYNWSSGASNISANNLTAGINSLIVTDDNGCSVTAFVELTAPVAMELTPTVLSDYEGLAVSCIDATDGKVAIAVNNGNTPYSFLWENGEAEAEAIALSAGENRVTVTDATGCTVEEIVDLSFYNITITTETVSDYNGADISCSDANDGAIQANVIAGISSPPNVTYAWNNGNVNALLEKISAGNYALTVTSAFGCTATAESMIEAPAPIQGATIATSNYNGFNISINGSDDGIATVNPSGGTAPYSILWENGETDFENESLSAGIQNVSITDANGCSTQTSIVLNQPTILDGYADVLSDYNGQDITCIGNKDGKAIAFGSGGVPPYTYAWSNNIFTDSTSQLESGTHQVTITDANGATFSTEVTLYEPDPIELELQSTPSSNPGDGTVSVIARGGASPFSFIWNDPQAQSGEALDLLESGWYRVTATDANGCQEDAQIEVEKSLEIICIKKNIVITPNGDGRNDFLSLNCIHPFNNDVEIYDRWGNLVFQAVDYDGSWTGLKRNKQVPDGGYFYIIRVALPTGKRTFKGSLTIIR
ncbi:MAG: gliding motility-associated C-terminal domain-containing protein [Saprospiraceae bacterium]